MSHTGIAGDPRGNMDRFVSHYLLRLDAKGRVRSRPLSLGAGARWLRWPLLLSGARPAGGGRGRDALLTEIEQLIASFPPFSEEREQFHTRALRDQRDTEDRRRGPGDLDRRAEDHAGIMEAVAFVGLGHKFQIWEPGPLPRAARGGHREGARAEEAAGRPERRRERARSTGMMAGSDGGNRLSLADWPVTFPCSPPGARAPRRRATAASISTAPSAPAAIRARILDAAGCARDRHRPRPERDRARRRLVEQRRRPARRWCEDALLRRSTTSRGEAASRRSTASCSTSASPRCSSTRPSAASRSAATARSTCAWASEGPSAADVVNCRERSAISPTIIFLLGEERHSRAHRPRHRRRRARSSRSRPPARSPISSRAWCAHEPGEIHPATRTFQALRIFVNDELGELADGAGGGGAHSEARRAAGGGVVPFAGRPHREDVLRRARPRRRRLAPCCRRRRHAAADLQRADEKAGRRRRGRDRRQSARALGQAARRRAHRRAAARRRSRDLLPRLPALADVMTGALMLCACSTSS